MPEKSRLGSSKAGVFEEIGCQYTAAYTAASGARSLARPVQDNFSRGKADVVEVRLHATGDSTGKPATGMRA